MLLAPLPAVAVTAILIALPPEPADWPQWRGPNRDGVSAETGLLQQWPAGGPPLLWRATGAGAGFSGVSIAAGRVFTMGDRGGEQFIVAFKASDGTPLWSAPVGKPTYDDAGVGPRGTPTVDGDRVYAIGTEGEVVSVDAGSGREHWRRSLASDFGGRMMSMWRFSESPLVDVDRVLVTPGSTSAGVVALDKRTGRDIWRAALPPSMGSRGADGAAYSSIVISNGAGVKQYVQLLGRGLVGVRASDGQVLWHYNRIANHVANIPTPLVKGDYVFSSTAYQTGAALLQLSRDGNGVKATEVYFLESTLLQNHHGGLVLVGDYIYGGHGHRLGFPFCLHMPTGKFMWGPDIRNDGTGSAAVVYADGRLYYRYENGRVILIEASPTGYRERGTFDIPDVRRPSWSHPVIAGGRLYLREQDTLYCYDLAGR